MHHFAIILIIVNAAYCIHDLCIVGNRTYAEDEKWVSGNFVMQCRRLGRRYWEVRIVACLSERHEIPLGETKTYGNFTYACTRKESGVGYLQWWPHKD